LGAEVPANVTQAPQMSLSPQNMVG